jgi:hypothetical protein
MFGVTVYFEIVGEISRIEIIATGPSIRDRTSLMDQYGPGRWRKLKGLATVRLASGRLRRAEIHWYEAHGKGRRRLKIKHFLE